MSLLLFFATKNLANISGFTVPEEIFHLKIGVLQLLLKAHVL